MGVEPNFAHAEYLGEYWSFIDCPGSVELSQEIRSALMAADTRSGGNKAEEVDPHFASYSCANHAAGLLRFSRAKNAGLILPHSSLLTWTRCQSSPPLRHMSYINPRLNHGVEVITIRPPETASMGETV